MQVTETNAEGLRRELKVVVPAGDIEQRVDTRLSEIQKDIRLPGFRPGKVPMSILRKRYRKSVMGEVVEGLVNESSQEAIADQGIRPALRPEIDIADFDDGKDLQINMKVEVLPDIEPPEVSDISIEKPVAEVSDETVNDALKRLAENQKAYEAVEEPRPAATGDQILIDFEGEMDGDKRSELASTDFALDLGAGRMIPGFEDQLIGASAGETKTVDVNFPDDYPAEDFRSKSVRFEVTVKEVRAPKETVIDDDFAKGLGFDGLDGLKDAIRKRTANEYDQQSKARMKRQLLDILAERHSFEVPPGMVKLEFDSIWRQVEEAMKNPDPNDPDKDKSEDQLRDEYTQIAERRVRLGLLLAEVGKAESIQVTQDELNQALLSEARRYPGQEREVIDFFQKNPQAIENLRAPILEDKVVDHIISKVSVEEKAVSVEELMKDPDDVAIDSVGTESASSETEAEEAKS